jgi:hypothetical protein
VPHPKGVRNPGYADENLNDDERFTQRFNSDVCKRQTGHKKNQHGDHEVDCCASDLMSQVERSMIKPLSLETWMPILQRGTEIRLRPNTDRHFHTRSLLT